MRPPPHCPAHLIKDHAHPLPKSVRPTLGSSHAQMRPPPHCPAHLIKNHVPHYLKGCGQLQGLATPPNETPPISISNSSLFSFSMSSFLKTTIPQIKNWRLFQTSWKTSSTKCHSLMKTKKKTNFWLNWVTNLKLLIQNHQWQCSWKPKSWSSWLQSRNQIPFWNVQSIYTKKSCTGK